MKKLICTFTTLALCATMSVPAFAADSITSLSGTGSAEVKGTYQSGSSTAVYSVDVEWGSMEFTYTAGSEGTWNPTTHTYDDATETGTWSCNTDANKITVTNHSNKAVKATLLYTKESNYSAISASFVNAESKSITDNILQLATAENTKVDSAPKEIAFLELTGSLSEGTSNATIGTVTVSIADNSEIGGGVDGPED